MAPAGIAARPRRSRARAAMLLAPVTLADYLQRDALLQRLSDGSQLGARQAL